MLKRITDIFISLFLLILFSPLFIFISLWIKADSKGTVFYRQKRVGKGGAEFWINKFRTMHSGADQKGLLTIGGKDNRITRPGYYLRKYKLDELPQFINVLNGDMSLVGPRPEVRKYTSLYTEKEKQILTVKPGITDFASIAFSNESELLARYPDPEKAYIEKIMPQKLQLNQEYIRKQSFLTDLRILWLTAIKVLRI